jgi:purine-binding chemotaxis protein CheW
MTSRRGRDEEALPAYARELLKRRADRVKVKPAVEVEDTQVWLAQFALGRELYAVMLHELRAVMSLDVVTPVPLAPPYVLGFLRYQGDMLTVFSLAGLLGVRGWQRDPGVLLIVEARPGRLTAFDCEQVPVPLAVPQRLVDDALSDSAGPSVEIHVGDHELVRLLTPARLLDQHLAGKTDGG